MSETAEPTVWARMRDEIERRGWAQYAGPAGLEAIRTMTQEEWFTAPCCLLMAIGAVLPDHRQGPYVERMHEHLGVTSLGRWNDAKDRTLGDVYGLLDDLDREDRADDGLSLSDVHRPGANTGHHGAGHRSTGEVPPVSGDRIDHAAAAREILGRLTPTRDTGPGLGMGYWSSYEGAQVGALRGIGHALLAIHERLGPSPLDGWTEVTEATDVLRTFAPTSDQPLYRKAPAEDRLEQLQRDLFESVEAAKAERDRVVAAREPAEDHGCA